MNWLSHARTTGTALKNWFVAQCYDSLAVALLWLVGLLIIGIPWAPLWALLAGVLQILPNFGGLDTVVPPALGGAISHSPARFFFLLILFAFIIVAASFFLRTSIM